MANRIVIGDDPKFCLLRGAAKDMVQTPGNPIRNAGASVLRRATPGEISNQDCLYLGKLGPDGQCAGKVHLAFAVGCGQTGNNHCIIPAAADESNTLGRRHH
jgi:hypothetical protein